MTCYVVYICRCIFFFCKQKTAYEMRISDWSSDVCSSDLHRRHEIEHVGEPCLGVAAEMRVVRGARDAGFQRGFGGVDLARLAPRSDPRDHFPYVLFGVEMVAPVAEQGDAIDQPPAKQFLDRIGNVRAREAEHFGDLLGMERTVGNEEQSMDLRDRAIDPHLPTADAPV